MVFTGIPTWVWGFISIAIAPAMAALALSVLWELARARPKRSIRLGDTTVELWVKERKYPSTAAAIVAPVAPDLKMVNGIAKWVRDATANKVQAEADAVAPLAPGEAFVGAAGRYKFGLTALAVVMDDKKVTSPQWISDSLRHALTLCSARGARSVAVPDMTEDLLRQPSWISDEQRRETCRPIARAMLDGIEAGSSGIDTVRIWVWRTVNEDIFLAELDALAGGASEARLAHARAGA